MVRLDAKPVKEEFKQQFEEAKAAVPEPPQSKIKLKVSGSDSAPAGQSKKITIHVGGRGGSTGSPTPLPSAGSHRSESQAPPGVGPTGLRHSVSQDAPGVVPSPSPSALKGAEDATQASFAPVSGAQAPQAHPMSQIPNGAVMTQQAFLPAPLPTPPRNPIWEYPWRPEGKGATLSKSSHPN